jgi:hypothetical protein
LKPGRLSANADFAGGSAANDLSQLTPLGHGPKQSFIDDGERYWPASLVAAAKVWVRMKKIAVKRPVVLVVDDDFLIRIGAVEMIEAAGFDVVEAANADEAMEILAVRLDIAVVFTDIQMPGSWTA